MTTFFFVCGYIYRKQEKMLFNLMLSDQEGRGSMYLVSADTITDCFNYAINTGKEIIQITKDFYTQLIINQSNSIESYNVVLNDGSSTIVYGIFDTKDNVLSWIANQIGKQVDNLQYIEREFVNI